MEEKFIKKEIKEGGKKKEKKKKEKQEEMRYREESRLNGAEGKTSDDFKSVMESLISAI